MLRTFTLVFFVLILLSFDIGAQSTSSIKIDPRQYISLKYRRSDFASYSRIWEWSNFDFVPNQKFQSLDIDGEIIIDVNVNDLIKNRDFSGNFTFEAEITGKDGTRKIQVSPYSEVGVNSDKIGIDAEPAYHLAQKTVNMIKELSGVEKVYDEIRNQRGEASIIRKEVVASHLQIQLEITRVLSVIKTEPSLDKSKSELKDVTSKVLAVVPASSREYETAKILDAINNAQTRQKLESVATDFFQEYNAAYAEALAEFVDTFTAGYELSRKKAKTTLAYLSSFETNGKDASEAFLKLIGLDVVLYKILKSQLVDATGKIEMLSIDFSKRDQAVDQLIENTYLIETVVEALYNISSIGGSEFERILLEEIDTKKGVKRNSDGSIEEREVYTKEDYSKIIDTNYSQIVESLSQKASALIFQRLAYGTIDLGNSGSKSGEILQVYVVWKRPEQMHIGSVQDETPQNGSRLQLGKFYLKPTGWKAEIVDMFGLIKRIGEPGTQSNVSPTNFKGSGGAVLLWTYYSLDKGIKQKTTSSYVRKNRIMNFLEPSFGINVSYLDFSTEKDVEIGTGAQIGLFRSKIFFGYGLNLHMLSPAGQRPFYYYVGFSFAKLSDLFKGSKKIDLQ